MKSPGQLAEERRQGGQEFMAAAAGAGLIEAAPAEERFSVALPEQWPRDPADETPAPPGGWWTFEAMLMARGWKPVLVDSLLDMVLQQRETLRRVHRDLRAQASNSPDRILVALRENSAERMVEAISACALDAWLTAETGQESNLTRWSWGLEEARMERYWRFAPAVLASLVHFDGNEADRLRAEVTNIATHPAPPKPFLPGAVLMR